MGLKGVRGERDGKFLDDARKGKHAIIPDVEPRSIWVSLPVVPRKGVNPMASRNATSANAIAIWDAFRKASPLTPLIGPLELEVVEMRRAPDQRLAWLDFEKAAYTDEWIGYLTESMRNTGWLVDRAQVVRVSVVRLSGPQSLLALRVSELRFQNPENEMVRMLGRILPDT